MVHYYNQLMVAMLEILMIGKSIKITWARYTICSRSNKILQIQMGTTKINQNKTVELLWSAKKTSHSPIPSIYTAWIPRLPTTKSRHISTPAMLTLPTRRMQPNNYKTSSSFRWQTRIPNHSTMLELVGQYQMLISQAKTAQLVHPRRRQEICRRTWQKWSWTRYMTTNSSKLQEMLPGNQTMAKVPSNNSRSKVREARVDKEVKVAKVSSNQIRSNDTYSSTTMMSWATHLVCISPCSTMTAATAKEEEITTATTKMAVISITTIIAIQDMVHNTVTQATNVILRIPTKALTVITVHWRQATWTTPAHLASRQSPTSLQKWTWLKHKNFADKRAAPWISMIARKILQPLILKTIKEVHYKILRLRINSLNIRTEIKPILCHSDLVV